MKISNIYQGTHTKMKNRVYTFNIGYINTCLNLRQVREYVFNLKLQYLRGLFEMDLWVFHAILVIVRFLFL